MLLTVEHLRVAFRVDGRESVPVRDVSFSVPPCGRVALVGESGCGKSLTALTLGGLVDRASISGRIVGHPRLAYVFQNPMLSLDPVMRIGRQLAEGARCREPITQLLAAVGLSPETERRFPCELSGGQQQRVMIAMALAAEPELLIADEPTTALDVITQRDVLDLIDRVATARGMAVLLITHNLGLVTRYARDMSVLYAGEVVEAGPVAEVLRNPIHPYTQGLLAAVPHLDLSPDVRLAEIPGTVPPPWNWPTGCSFHPRCPYATADCSSARRPTCWSRAPISSL